MKITIGYWPKNTLASKQLHIDAESGDIRKVTPVFPVGINAIVKDIPFEKLAQAKKYLKSHPKERIAQSVILNALPVDADLHDGREFVIASSKRYQSVVNQVARSSKPQTPVITRTKRDLARYNEPGFLLIDVDRIIDYKSVLNSLIAVCVDIAFAPTIIWPSSSGLVYKTGEDKPVNSGWHILIHVNDNSKVFAAAKRLHRRLAANACGWVEISNSGKPLLKTYVDPIATQITQPLFWSEPLLGKGLSRADFEPLVFNSGSAPLDIDAAIPPLSHQEIADYVAQKKTLIEESADACNAQRERYIEQRAVQEIDRIKKKTGHKPDILEIRDNLRQQLASSDSGNLEPSQPVHFDDQGWVTVQEIIDNPQNFVGMTCADPVEPFYGSGDTTTPARYKAIVKIIDDREGKSHLVIYSFAHGGQLFRLGETDDFSGSLIGNIDEFDDFDTEILEPEQKLSDAKTTIETLLKIKHKLKNDDLEKSSVDLPIGEQFLNAKQIKIHDLQENPIKSPNTKKLISQKISEVLKSQGISGRYDLIYINNSLQSTMISTVKSMIEEDSGAYIYCYLGTKEEAKGLAQSLKASTMIIPSRSEACKKIKGLEMMRKASPFFISKMCVSETIEDGLPSTVYCEHFNNGCQLIDALSDTQSKIKISTDRYSALHTDNPLLNQSREHIDSIGVFTTADMTTTFQEISADDLMILFQYISDRSQNEPDNDFDAAKMFVQDLQGKAVIRELNEVIEFDIPRGVVGQLETISRDNPVSGYALAQMSDAEIETACKKAVAGFAKNLPYWVTARHLLELVRSPKAEVSIKENADKKRVLKLSIPHQVKRVEQHAGNILLVGEENLDMPEPLLVDKYINSPDSYDIVYSKDNQSQRTIIQVVDHITGNINHLEKFETSDYWKSRFREKEDTRKQELAEIRLQNLGIQLRAIAQKDLRGRYIGVIANDKQYGYLQGCAVGNSSLKRLGLNGESGEGYLTTDQIESEECLGVVMLDTIRLGGKEIVRLIKQRHPNLKITSADASMMGQAYYQMKDGSAKVASELMLPNQKYLSQRAFSAQCYRRLKSLLDARVDKRVPLLLFNHLPYVDPVDFFYKQDDLLGRKVEEACVVAHMLTSPDNLILSPQHFRDSADNLITKLGCPNEAIETLLGINDDKPMKKLFKENLSKYHAWNGLILTLRFDN